jgi:hypothetical protein
MEQIIWVRSPYTHEEDRFMDKHSAEDLREAYQPPELTDLGSVAELTKTGAVNPGADGLYS